jgi:hypothetical protein
MKWIKSRYGKQSFIVVLAFILIALISGLSVYAQSPSYGPAASPSPTPSTTPLSEALMQNVTQITQEGQQIFRFDTFGDEAFWGSTLNLHQAIQGTKFGGVGDGVSPKTALSVGLKVDMDALPASLVSDLQAGKVNLDDPTTTLALLKLNAVLGVTGFFDNAGQNLTSMGIQCALCHSTVDNEFAMGIGHRLDGVANHDLNVGAIISLSPTLQPVADFLGVDVATVKIVLAAWGPGKFDAELFLDGKGFNPQQVTSGSLTSGNVTVNNVSAATLIPNALGLGGHSQHTWTGAWGGITYWNAFVANLEMHGIGNFFDPRLDNAEKYPIAAKNKSGHIQTDPDSDRITSKLRALQFYQLALPIPTPVAGKDYDAAAAVRGDALFSGKANCQSCHNENIWTEAGWDLHKSSDIGIDDFQASRGPDGVLKTANLAAIFIRENGLYMDPANKGLFYHDGRFKTLKDVVMHYNDFLSLGLTDAEMNDLVEYLKSLGANPSPVISPTPSPSHSPAPTAY